MMASLLLFFVACISSASSLVVCRLSSFERVTCPEDFYCCGVDQCCKLTFEVEDEDSSKESLNNWVTALCVRTVIVTGFMVLLLIVGKSIQYCRKRYFGQFCSKESSLPRYLPLEKNSIATDIGSISALMGTPFYPVNTEHVGFRGGVPMVVY